MVCYARHILSLGGAAAAFKLENKAAGKAMKVHLPSQIDGPEGGEKYYRIMQAS